jgi:hypothetical protein
MIFFDRRNRMKSIKGIGLSLALSLGLALSAVGFAQNTTPNEQNKKAESCCEMASCFCKGDENAAKDKSCCKEHTAEHKGCCGGDSCNMKMKKKDKQKEG